MQIYWALQALQPLAKSLPDAYDERPEALQHVPTVLRLLGTYLAIQPDPPYIGERPGEGKVIQAA